MHDKYQGDYNVKIVYFRAPENMFPEGFDYNKVLLNCVYETKFSQYCYKLTQ